MGHDDATAIVPALRAALASDHLRLLLCVMETLGEIGPEAAEAVPSVMTLLEHSDTLTRGVAASTLGRIGPAAKIAVPKLAQALSDPDGQVRLHSAWALAQMGPEAGPALPQLLEQLNRPWGGMAGGQAPTGLAPVFRCDWGETMKLAVECAVDAVHVYVGNGLTVARGDQEYSLISDADGKLVAVKIVARVPEDE